MRLIEDICRQTDEADGVAVRWPMLAQDYEAWLAAAWEICQEREVGVVQTKFLLLACLRYRFGLSPAGARRVYDRAVNGRVPRAHEESVTATGLDPPLSERLVHDERTQPSPRLQYLIKLWAGKPIRPWVKRHEKK